MRGCRGYQAGRLPCAPDRLTCPLLRIGHRGSGEFALISWEEALDRVAEGLTSVYHRYGPKAMLNLAGYGSARRFCITAAAPAAASLLDGSAANYSCGSYSRGAANYAIPFVLATRREGMDPAR